MSEPRMSRARFTWRTNFYVLEDTATFALAEYQNVSSNYPDMRLDKSRKPLAWFVYNAENAECIMHVSRNMNLPVNQIAIKDYSENAGALDCMKELGIIHDRALSFIRSGWVEIPVHLLTEKGMGIVQELGFA